MSYSGLSETNWTNCAVRRGGSRAAGLAPQSAPLHNRDNLFPKDRGLANLTDSYADIYWAKHTSERVQDTKNVKHTCKSPLHHLKTPVTTRHSTLMHLHIPAQLHNLCISYTPQQQLHIPLQWLQNPNPRYKYLQQTHSLAAGKHSSAADTHPPCSRFTSVAREPCSRHTPLQKTHKAAAHTHLSSSSGPVDFF